MRMMAAIRKNEVNKNIPFLLSGLIVAFFLCFAPLTHDDRNSYSTFAKSASVSEMAQNVYERFFTWSSRFIIEFFLLIIEKMPKPVWALTMGVFWGLLLWAISKLVTDEKNTKLNVFLSLLSLLFPFRIWSSAGWIATSFTYLTPITMGMITLLPIRYLYQNIEKENLTLGKWAAYSMMMLYAGNLEQMAVTLFFIYFVMIVYEFVCRKIDFFHLWMLLLSGVGILVAFLCPGNKARTVSNTMYWFPTYDMLNFFDKAEIALTTAASWLLRSQNLFWFIVAFLLAVTVFKKYEDVYYKIIASLPTAITLFFILGRSLFGERLPIISQMTMEIPRNGLFNASNGFSKVAFCEWILIGLFYLSIVLSVALICRSMAELCFFLSLLFAGFGSRWMMGFSPTIYASGFRTCMILTIILIANGAKLFYMVNIKNVRWLYAAMCILAMVNLCLWGQMIYSQL